ncbi:hypothetical protein CAMRE0001_1690 [Campylobacter rectus RM3267]|uniref:Uncharacterized protein n=1 Tax=Campylobacter rectus RM3267 TaxID=553218 RepID=B9CZA5_CAMRE|nr:hypothetical protein CAMRE0001_1690 [Campylobacter rectus RM3267]
MIFLRFVISLFRYDLRGFIAKFNVHQTSKFIARRSASPRVLTPPELFYPRGILAC